MIASWTEHWPIILGVVVGLFLVGSLVHRLRGPNRKKAAADRMEADAEDPLRAWSQAAFKIVTGGIDYGHLGPGEGRRMLQRWWQIHGEHEMNDALDELATGTDSAWELLRFILVSRMGAAAGYLTDEESWSEIRPIAARLQGAYDSWGALAHAYLNARRQWQEVAPDGSEDDPTMQRIAANIEELRATSWTEVPYDLAFEDEA